MNNGKNFYDIDERQKAMISSNNKYKYTDISQLYEFFEVLGEGSFSKVYKAKFLPSGEMIAVKVSILNYA